MNPPDSATLSLLEYRLNAVAIGHLALLHRRNWTEIPRIQMYFDGKLVIEGKATAFTNAAIESAIIHGRALLEFLGLNSKSKSELRERGSRKDDDVGIEQFGSLNKISIIQAVSAHQGDKGEIEAALAYVIYLANKGLAHTTTRFELQDELLEIALHSIPVLVINNFYIPLGLPQPKCVLSPRIRATDE